MMHRGYDYVISPSDITADYFCEAFDTDKSRVVKYGLPRIDYIKSVAAGERHDDTARRILTKYPQLRRQDRQENRPPVNFKKVILYAPTFRPGKAVDVQSLIDSLDPEKYELVVKLHPVYKGAVQGRQTVENGSGSTLNVIYDESFSSYDWLSVADIIVSDYSSFVIEAALADKPLFIYAYDLKEYDTSTGLNMDFYSEPIAPYVFEDACALSQGIDKKYDMDLLCAFRDRYIDIDTGSNADDNHCTAKLADFIESLM